MQMRASQSAIDLIQHFETCELEAYPDPASPLGQACTAAKLSMRDYRKVQNWKALSGAPWTIAWGHTGKEIVQGLVWTRLQADRQFEADLLAVERLVNSLLRVEVTQSQFDAIVSFVFNVGPGKKGLKDGFAELKSGGTSSMLRLLNAGNFAAAADEFPKWTKASGKQLAGLLRRRLCEQALFMGEDWRKAA